MADQWAAGRVRFDFEGSLGHARQLWALAETLEAQRLSRRTDADAAAACWRGRFADDFAVRMSEEQADFTRVIGSLRDEARAWAMCWRNAMDEQNRRNHAAGVEAVRAKRGWVERNIGDRFLGDDSEAQVACAAPASLPAPPYFAPTQREVRF